MKSDAGCLIFEIERLGIVERNASREEILGVPQSRVNDGRRNTTEIQTRAVACHLAVERRIAPGEHDGEAELPRVEGAGGADIGDKDLRLGSEKNGPRRLSGVCAGHRSDSPVCHELAPGGEARQESLLRR